MNEAHVYERKVGNGFTVLEYLLGGIGKLATNYRVESSSSKIMAKTFMCCVHSNLNLINELHKNNVLENCSFILSFLFLERLRY